MRIARAIRDLEQAAGHRLMEVNHAATELLLKGTVVDGLPEWDYGRPQPVKFIDFENPANDFLVINQFKVELTSGRGHVIPDAVLFVNGIPLVVAEFKSGYSKPLQEASTSFYATRTSAKSCSPRSTTRTRRGAAFPHESASHCQQFFEARGYHSARHRKRIWNGRTTSPVPMSTVAEELGVLSPRPNRLRRSRKWRRWDQNNLSAPARRSLFPQG